MGPFREIEEPLELTPGGTTQDLVLSGMGYLQGAMCVRAPRKMRTIRFCFAQEITEKDCRDRKVCEFVCRNFCHFMAPQCSPRVLAAINFVPGVLRRILRLSGCHMLQDLT